MADIWSKKKRSEVMALIRSKGNKVTELGLASLFRSAGISGWRRNQKVFGKPDFVFRKHHLAVFVDGCFWHGCPRCYRGPDSNRKYWNAKILRNRQRDREVARALRKAGWRLIRVWECALAERPAACTRKIQAALDAARTAK